VNTEHKRVLVSSQNNSAVDNVLTKFKDMKSIQMLRLGQELKISSDVQPFMFVNRITELEERIAGAIRGTDQESGKGNRRYR